MNYLRPRSVSIAGRRTTMRLEDQYWKELRRICIERGQSIGQVLTDIAAEAPDNFTSAVRMFIFSHVCEARDRALAQRTIALRPNTPPGRDR